MVEDQDVNVASGKGFYDFIGSGTAVDGEEKFDRVFLKAVFHAVLSETIAFIEPMGQVVEAGPAERAKEFREERSGSDAIDVVIPEDDERFVVFMRFEQAVHGTFDVRKEQWI
jgi:hypothetical protein